VTDNVAGVDVESLANTFPAYHVATPRTFTNDGSAFQQQATSIAEDRIASTAIERRRDDAAHLDRYSTSLERFTLLRGREERLFPSGRRFATSQNDYGFS